MSTRKVNVKSFNNNNKNRNYHHNGAVKPMNNNNHQTHHQTNIQQPRKNYQKLQATPKRHQKKMVAEEEEKEEIKSMDDQIYAGPTFSNAPAPSALPIPAFNSRGSPLHYHQPMYNEQLSMNIMNLITPQKVITAYELEQTNLALSEIQRGLRSMLKIES